MTFNEAALVAFLFLLITAARWLPRVGELVFDLVSPAKKLAGASHADAPQPDPHDRFPSDDNSR